MALVAQQRLSSTASFDARVYALTPGNAAFLKQIGVWDAIPAERRVPVHAMRIYGDQSSMLEFDAYGAGVPELAWIVEDRLLQEALWHELEVDVLRAQPESLAIGGESAVLGFQDGSQIEAKLIVGADGASSFVRREAGIAASEREYGQHAVVANFRCSKPHANIAHQWFQRAAVLALLPLAGDHVSMVWSLPSGEAGGISALGEDAFSSAVEATAHGVLGQLTLVTPPRSYPLRRLSAARMVAPRVALAGDAAHVIHPLAGQGLNLGLQDARTLAAVISTREPARDPGELRLLRRYERRRAEPILAMDTMVDSLFRLFGAQGGTAARLRNAGLNLTDRLPVVKNMLMRQAMR